MIVRAVLKALENRLARIQPMAPAAVAGGGKDAAGELRTKDRPRAPPFPKESAVKVEVTAPSPLDQRDARVVPVHQQRGDEADAEVDGHGEGDDLDRLPGLIEHRAGENL